MYIKHNIHYKTYFSVLVKSYEDGGRTPDYIQLRDGFLMEEGMDIILFLKKLLSIIILHINIKLNYLI